MSAEDPGAVVVDKKKLGPCMVCEEDADGYFFGANVCLPCKSFFVRTLSEDASGMKCSKNTSTCVIVGTTRSSCKYCRFQKCLKIGMTRKVRPEVVEAGDNQELCAVCQDIANGIHFGALTCEGCKKFFRRSLKEYGRYVCRYDKNCTVNPRTRNACRYCRYQKCLRQGMSKDVKIGRPRKELLLSLSSESSGTCNTSVTPVKESDKAEEPTIEKKSIDPSDIAQNKLGLETSSPGNSRHQNSKSSSDQSTPIDIVHTNESVSADKRLSTYDTMDIRGVEMYPQYTQGMQLNRSSVGMFENIENQTCPTSFDNKEEPRLLSMLLSSRETSETCNNSIENMYSLERSNDKNVGPPQTFQDSSMSNSLHGKTSGVMPLQSVNPTILDHGSGMSMNMYSTLDHCEASKLMSENFPNKSMDMLDMDGKCDESINILKHKLDYSMEKENVCSCKKLRKLAVESMDVPMTMKALLMRRIEYGDVKEGPVSVNPSLIGRGESRPNTMPGMSKMMGIRGADNTPNPFSMMSKMTEMDSNKHVTSKMDGMESVSYQSQMMPGQRVMDTDKKMSMTSGMMGMDSDKKMSMMSRMMGMDSDKKMSMMSKMMGMDTDKKMSMMSSMMGMDTDKKMSMMSSMMGMDTDKKMSMMSSMMGMDPDKKMSMMSSMMGMDSDKKLQMISGMKPNMSDMMNIKKEAPQASSCVSGMTDRIGSTTFGSDSGPELKREEASNFNVDSNNDKELFSFKNIIEKFDRIKCPSCSNGYFIDPDWDNLSNKCNEKGSDEISSLPAIECEQICFVHSPQNADETSVFSHIPPSNSNCICLKDIISTTNINDNACASNDSAISIQDIQIKPPQSQTPISHFTMMLEKMMDQRQLTENQHKFIHPTPQSCTDTIDRLRKLLKFFGIEEIQPKPNARFESHVFPKEYWQNPELPDENILLDLKNKEMLEVVVSAYNHLITIMHEKVVGSKPSGDKVPTFQWPMDIVRKRTIRNLSHWITFIKTIPNFVHINTSDQFTIVRLGGMMGIMLATALHQYDPEEHNFTNFYNFEFDPEHPHYHFRYAFLDFGRDIQDLQCDFVESAMINACMAVALVKMEKFAFATLPQLPQTLMWPVQVLGLQPVNGKVKVYCNSDKAILYVKKSYLKAFSTTAVNMFMEIAKKVLKKRPATYRCFIEDVNWATAGELSQIDNEETSPQTSKITKVTHDQEVKDQKNGTMVKRQPSSAVLSRECECTPETDESGSEASDIEEPDSEASDTGELSQIDNEEMSPQTSKITKVTHDQEVKDLKNGTMVKRQPSSAVLSRECECTPETDESGSEASDIEEPDSEASDTGELSQIDNEEMSPQTSKITKVTHDQEVKDQKNGTMDKRQPSSAVLSRESECIPETDESGSEASDSEEPDSEASDTGELSQIDNEEMSPQTSKITKVMHDQEVKDQKNGTMVKRQPSSAVLSRECECIPETDESGSEASDIEEPDSEASDNCELSQIEHKTSPQTSRTTPETNDKKDETTVKTQPALLSTGYPEESGSEESDYCELSQIEHKTSPQTSRTTQETHGKKDETTVKTQPALLSTGYREESGSEESDFDDDSDYLPYDSYESDTGDSELDLDENASALSSIPHINSLLNPYDELQLKDDKCNKRERIENGNEFKQKRLKIILNEEPASVKVIEVEHEPAIVNVHDEIMEVEQASASLKVGDKVTDVKQNRNDKHENENSQNMPDEIDDNMKLFDINNKLIFTRKVLKSETKKSNQKKKGKRVYNSYHSCYICGDLVQHIRRHLRSKHSKTPEVVEIFKDPLKIDQRFAELRTRGDDKHNTEVVKQGKGEILLMRRPTTATFNVNDYGPCPFCREWMLKRTLSRHQKNCICSNSERCISAGSLNLQSEILSGRLTSVASEELKIEVFSIMLRDSVSTVAQNDTLITALGESWLKRNISNKLKRKYYASQRMRLTARYLIKLRELEKTHNTDHTIDETQERDLWYFLCPEKFDLCTKAAIQVSIPFMDDEEDLKAPSNAIKMKYDVIRLVNAKWAYIAKLKGKEDTDLHSDKKFKGKKEADLKSCKQFLQLLNIEWAEKVTRLARMVLQQRQYSKVREIPSPDDVRLLSEYTVGACQALNLKKDATTYRRATVLASARLVAYNKRRSGEIDAISLKDYAQRKTKLADVDQSMLGELSELERFLLNSQDLMTVRGKRSKPVSVLIPGDVKNILQYLSLPENREVAGIRPENKFLFPNKALGAVRSYDALKMTCSESHMKNPERITSVNLRKYTATLAQVMNLDRNQMEHLCKHLSHTKRVHLEHYQQMSGFIERVEISKLLLIQDLDLAGKYKNVQDVTIKDYPDLEEPKVIEDIRINLLEAFRAYTTAKYGTPNGRVEKIFAWIPRLRDLGMWNYKLSFSTCFSFEEAAGAASHDHSHSKPHDHSHKNQ